MCVCTTRARVLVDVLCRHVRCVNPNVVLKQLKLELSYIDMNNPSSQSLLTCIYECEADLTGFVDHKGNLNMYEFVFIHTL